jgi:hypothetical protein
MQYLSVEVVFILGKEACEQMNAAVVQTIPSFFLKCNKN